MELVNVMKVGGEQLVNDQAAQGLMWIAQDTDSVTQEHIHASVIMDGLEKDATFLIVQAILIAMEEVTFLRCALSVLYDS